MDQNEKDRLDKLTLELQKEMEEKFKSILQDIIVFGECKIALKDE